MKSPSLPRRTLIAVLALGIVMSIAGYKLAKSTTFQLFGGLTSRVSTEAKVVALTFDDGPTCDDVDEVLTVTRGVPATFYLIGNNIESCPEGARRLVEAGAEIGNHTWNHRRMVFVGPRTVSDEIRRTDDQIRAAGYTREITFRPPYGKKLLILPWWLSQQHRQTITWDVSVETWDGHSQDAETIAGETVAQVRPGSIILLHPWNNRAQTQRAIPLIVKQLREQGYTFLTVSELTHG